MPEGRASRSGAAAPGGLISPEWRHTETIQIVVHQSVEKVPDHSVPNRMVCLEPV
jgi:hypothetical protein